MSRALFENAPGPHRVMVRVRGGAQVSPLPDCPGAGQSCRDRDEYTSRWEMQNAETQRSVREFIVQVGGQSSSETFWLVNAFEATLTLSQMEEVAQHPDVESIEPAEGGSFH